MKQNEIFARREPVESSGGHARRENMTSAWHCSFQIEHLNIGRKEESYWTPETQKNVSPVERSIS